LRLIGQVEDAALGVVLAVMIVLAGAEIALRNLFGMGIAWGDQVSRVLVLWVGLLGAVVASRDNRHINIDILSRFLGTRAKAAARLVVGLFTSAVSALVAYHGARFVYLDYQAQATAFGSVPAWIVELVIPFGFAAIAARYMLYSLLQLKALGWRRDEI